MARTESFQAISLFSNTSLLIFFGVVVFGTGIGQWVLAAVKNVASIPSRVNWWSVHEKS